MITRLLVGDVFERMTQLDDSSFDLIVTSPPFYGVRSYLPDDHPQKHLEIGSEDTPAEYLDKLFALTAEWRRLLTPHGSLAVELGDTYAGSGGAGGDYDENGLRDGQLKFRVDWSKSGISAKSLVGIPQSYMLGLVHGRNPITGATSPAGQWRIRNLKPWIRSNPPVGALGDKERPATSYITVACTSAQRWFDLDAVRTGLSDSPGNRYVRRRHGHPSDYGEQPVITADYSGGAPPLDWWHHVDAIIDTEIDQRAATAGRPNGGNAAGPKIQAKTDGGWSTLKPLPRQLQGARGVHIRRALEKAGILTTLDAYDVSPKGYAGSHYAVWPKELVKLLIAEMCPPGGRILDPFGGSGTTGAVASGMGRDSVLIDLDERNADLARERIGMFLEVVEREESYVDDVDASPQTLGGAQVDELLG